MYAGGDLRVHDHEERSPRDWAALQPNAESRLAILALITTFHQLAASKYRATEMDDILGTLTGSSQGSLRLPPKWLRNRLADIGLACKGNCKDVGPFGQIKGTGFGQVIKQLNILCW